MSIFVFNIACPRCETAVKIYLGQSEFLCSCCAFNVVIEDKDGLLEAFKKGDVEDLDFVERPIKDPSSSMETGLKLVFSRISDETGQAIAAQGAAPHEDAQVDVDEFGNKTANTQIIELTFDPSQYLDEVRGQAATARRSNNKKISLKKVIKHAETAKPPKPTKSQTMMRNITLIIIIALIGGMIAFLIFQNQ